MDVTIPILPWQAAAYEDTSPYLAIVGGRGSAKTRFACMKVHRWLEGFPSVPFGIAADTYGKLRANFMEEFSRFLAAIGYEEGREFHLNKSEHKYYWYNGASLECFTMDKDPERSKGPTLGGVVGDETDQWSEKHWEIFEICARDPRGPRQRVVLANATPPTHWINQRFENPLTRLKDHKLIRVSSYQNTFLPADEIRKLEQTYKPGTLQHRRWVLAEAVAMSGALWPEFQVDRHVFSGEAPPAAMLNAAGLDLGFRDPYAFITARVDRNGRIYITQEYEQAELSALKQAPVIQAMYPHGPIFSDHDASERAVLRDLGVKTILAQKDIGFGVELVRQLIIQDKLQVSDRCPLTVAAIQNSTWNDKTEREIPRHDKYSHIASALRYLCVGVHGESNLAASLAAG